MSGNIAVVCGAGSHRRATTAVAVCIVGYLDERARLRGRNYVRKTFCFDSFVFGIPPRLFRRVYRMNRDDFDNLCDALACYERRLPTSTKLSMTLRWLAGGSYLDISLSHYVAISSFFYIVDRTLIELNAILKIEFRAIDVDYLHKTSVGFSRHGRSPLSGCVGALDGIAIKIQEPCRGSVPNPSTYFNRKGFFALSVQAMCDSRYCFTFASAISPGSTHDSTSFAMSSLSRLLCSSNGLVPGYWVAADDAYVCSERVMTPWPGRNLSKAKDAFNYWQSSARIHIEQAFGMLVARWGVLWRPLRVSIEKVGQVAIVCMKLHNYIIERSEILQSDGETSVTIPDPSTLDTRGHTEVADMSLNFQDELDMDEQMHRRRRDLEPSDLREMFTRQIQDEGLIRPLVQ
jgi:hypothetical protein